MSQANIRTQRGHSKLRKGRRSLANQIYHISSATEGRRTIFHELDYGRLVVTAMRREQQAGHAETLAFVVMPDHFHWLLLLSGSRSLSVCVNTVKSFSTRRINQRLSRHGRVWQTGFYDRAIRRDDDLVHVARYIIANPLRAGIVESVRDYPLWDAKWV
jgi:REP element-mobilizing transposase RayT